MWALFVFCRQPSHHVLAWHSHLLVPDILTNQLMISDGNDVLFTHQPPFLLLSSFYCVGGSWDYTGGFTPAMNGHNNASCNLSYHQLAWESKEETCNGFKQLKVNRYALYSLHSSVTTFTLHSAYPVVVGTWYMIQVMCNNLTWVIVVFNTNLHPDTGHRGDTMSGLWSMSSWAAATSSVTMWLKVAVSSSLSHLLSSTEISLIALPQLLEV